LLGGSSASSFAFVLSEITSGCDLGFPIGTTDGFVGSVENVFFATDRVGSRCAASPALMG
jgi:hypothetical protein